MKTLKIIDLDHQGRGIAKDNQKVIFISNALPEEIVNVDIIKDYKKYSVGEILSYENFSDDRVKPLCPFYNECGGCDIQHISYNKQLEFKKKKVINIFKKFLNKDITTLNIMGKEQYTYRNKITLHVKDGKLGMLKKYSHEIVNIDKCLIVDDQINKLISKLSKIKLDSIESIIIKKGDSDCLISLYLNGPLNTNEIEALKAINNNIIIYYNKTKEILSGNDFVIITINGLKFKVMAEAFFQVNQYRTVDLYDTVLRYANIDKSDVVMDLYCGTGTISSYVSKYCNKVIGVEINEDAVKSARENNLINGITNVEYILKDVSKLGNVFNNIDVVIVDPPRSGLNSETIDALNNTEIKRLVYVSCDPMTLVRDIKNLNYEFKDITLVDMFPNTYHVECVVLLEKKLPKKC